MHVKYSQTFLRDYMRIGFWSTNQTICCSDALKFMHYNESGVYKIVEKTRLLLPNFLRFLPKPDKSEARTEINAHKKM